MPNLINRRPKPKPKDAQKAGNRDQHVMGRPKNLKIIAIASGKGGVGKSTIAILLALAAKELGLQVGLVDADIHGPSLPLAFGLDQHRIKKGTEIGLDFVDIDGLQLNSIGFFTSNDKAIAWRGPMAGRAAQQLICDTYWQERDLLIIDLPPGSSDIHLSLAQKGLIDAAILVTMPQNLAVADARRGAELLQKLKLPILGVVENMSYLKLPDGNRFRPFGDGGGAALAQLTSAPYLLALPQLPELSKAMDIGHASKALAKLDQETQQQWLRFIQKILTQLKTLSQFEQ